MATDRTERLLNLVICLLGASRAVSRAALRDSIPGYGDAASSEAFERMFERDKEELRQMGIPVETVVNAQGEVDGYRINPDDYAMPDLRLEPTEWAVLGLAARMWNEAALAAEAAAALRKIEATSGGRSTQLDLVSTRPGSGEVNLPLLWESIRTRTVLRFDYLARGQQESQTRTVEPWATVHRDGAWYLIGLSRERGAARAFRLSRIQGGVETLREIAAVPPRADVEIAIATIGGPAPRGEAIVDLPDSGAAHLKHRARQRTDGRWDVPYADDDVLVAEATEARGRIIEPAHLAAAQAQSLERVLAAHDG